MNVLVTSFGAILLEEGTYLLFFIACAHTLHIHTRICTYVYLFSELLCQRSYGAKVLSEYAAS